MDYTKNNIRTDVGKGRGYKREGETRESHNPKHGKRKHYVVHTPSRLN
jgi:hypothetical protein